MKASKVIPIVVSPDDNYVIPTYIMLHSLIQNKGDEDIYDIVILANDLQKENSNFLKSLEKEGNNIRVRELTVGDVFKQTEIVLTYISVAALYRLMLPKLLPEYDKCIYIDGDALIQGDISTAFHIDIRDNYIGAVRDIEAERYINEFDYEITPPTDAYVNSGFLLMNLRKMREDELTEHFKNLSQKKFLFIDQDILNICCHGKIYFLPLKCNAMVKYRFLHYRMKEYANNVTDYFTLDEIYEAQDDPIMIHYAQPIKPWHCKYVYKGDDWRKYVKHEIKNAEANLRIKQYIKDNRKPFSVQIKLGVRYLLRKTFAFKLLLKMKGKI